MRIQQPNSETAVAAMFDRIAPRYDLLNRLLSARQDQRWRRHLVEAVPVRSGGAYLDVATGTGDVIVAARLARREYQRFVGVDIASQMLRRAEEKWAAASPDLAAEFALQSAESLAFEPESFDCLSIAFGLRNVVNREQALREFQRVLKVGSTLLVLEFFPPERGLFAKLFQVYFHHILPFVGGLLGDAAAYRYLPESVGSFYTPAAFRSALRQAGFAVKVERSYLFGCCRLVSARRV